MSNRIKGYYRERVKKEGSNNFLWQVGKTVDGKNVPRDHVDLIIKTIASKLQLEKGDFVLDIGSGNGLLTKKISGYVSKICGIELTRELYNIAEKYNVGDNVSYINCNILNFDATVYKKKFTKVYLYEVIQHIDYRETDALFAMLNKITKNNATIFIGGVLDIEKKWIFFDTEERRCAYFTGLISGSDPLGIWYHKEFFNFLAKKHNLNVECLEQESKLYTSHYRFDCLLWK